MDRIGIVVMYWRRCKHFKCSNRKLNKISIHQIHESINHSSSSFYHP
jgi:ribosome biogenesis protein Tsr3